VPADLGEALWEALLAAGDTHGLEPLGLDALMQLRLEKGFLHIGTDTDGTTVPEDVGWGKVAGAKTRDYIGRRSLTLLEHLRPNRSQLVGLTGVAPSAPSPPRRSSRRLARGRRASVSPESAMRPFIVGSHLRLDGSMNATDGWITSAGVATVTREPIALALLRAGRQHLGAEINVFDGGRPVARARVVSPPFYDPTGERMNA